MEKLLRFGLLTIVITMLISCGGDSVKKSNYTDRIW